MFRRESSSEMHRYEPEMDIKQLMERMMKKFRIEEDDPRILLKSGWEDIVGKPMAEHTKPFDLKDGNLYVKVDHATWAQNLSIYRRRILEELQKKYPSLGIKNIRVFHG